MQTKAFSLTMAAMLALTLIANAQFRLPSFDIGVRGGYLHLNDNFEESDGQNRNAVFESLLGHGEANIHFGQHLALGYFYQRSIIISNYHEEGGGGGSRFDQDAEHLMHGLNFRISAGRAPKLRPYGQLKYAKYEVVVDYGGFRLASKGNALGFGGGVMLRLGHNFYFNLIEAELYKLLSVSEVMLNNKDMFFELKTGITYNFSKRK
jgi:hypothetical protein